MPDIAPGEAQATENGPMHLPVRPPVAPMLARLVDDIPVGSYAYEPKWDGFRAIVFRDRDDVEIGSRNERPMQRYFPELVTAIRRGLPERCVLDGEIVVPDHSRGRLDFEALQQRIHPAESRVRLLAGRTPAHYVAFDLLAIGGRDLTNAPFRERRRVLEEVLSGVQPPVHLTPTTRDPGVARRWFDQFEGAGLDGIVAKPLDLTYQPDRRVMSKIKHVRTADCVVAGYRIYKTDAHAVGSLLLGLYDDRSDLAFVGVVGAFTATRRRALFDELQPLVTTFDGHPWAWGESGSATRTPASSAASRWTAGKDLTFVTLRPERVVEVRYDHLEGERFRHTTQFVHWRADRDPRSCTFSQLEEPVSFALSAVL
jgi:ATP-dependent DNA ligase